MRLALPFLLLASPALAAGTIIVSPVYSQLVALPTPPDFVAGNEQAKDGFYILELAPKGQTMAQWTQLITLTGAKDAASDSAVTTTASQIGGGYQAACPASFAARTLPAPKVRGALKVFAGYLGCGAVNGQSEAMVFLVLQGKSEIYRLQWSERGPPQDTAPQPDPAIWKPRAELLALSRICDKLAGEAAPYPSCTQ